MSARETMINVGSLQDRPVERADMVVGVTAFDSTDRLVARDALDGRLARLTVRRAPRPQHPAGVVASAFLRPFALSPEGSHLLFGEPDIGGSRIVWHTLATGTTEELLPEAGSDVTAAAFAPAGNRIAALGQNGDRATVTVLGPAAGGAATSGPPRAQRRKIRRSPGRPTVDSSRSPVWTRTTSSTPS